MITERERGKYIRGSINQIGTGFLTEYEIKEAIKALQFMQGFFEDDQIVLSGIGTYLSHLELIANARQIEYGTQEAIS